MLNIFKKKREKQRNQVIEEFTGLVEPLKTKPEQIQILVGHGINIGNSLFFKNVTSINEFNNLPDKKKFDFFKKFLDFKEKMKNEDQYVYLGLHLYATWILAVINNDNELQLMVSSELKWISKKGELMQGTP